jgi:hypothetical protein
MKNICQLILIITTIVLLHSCQKEIDFDTKLIEPKMVINGFLQQDSLISISIGTSKAIPGVEKPNVWIKDATVKLYVDGEEKETLSAYNIIINTNNQYGDQSKPTTGYRSNSIKAEMGKSYKLVVSHPNYKTVTCETSIPAPISILNIDTISKIDASNGYSNTKFQVKIRFKDTSGEKNYYRLVYKTISGNAGPKNNIPGDTAYVISVNNQTVGTYINSDDPIINPSDDANELLFGSPTNTFNLFTDDLIDGKEYELSFFCENYDYNYIFSPNNLNTSIGAFFILDVELQSITREAYLYMRSVNAFNYYNDNFLSEPVQVYTNVENGLGIFAGFSANSKSISKGKYPMDGVEYKIQNNNGYFSYNSY